MPGCSQKPEGSPLEAATQKNQSIDPNGACRGASARPVHRRTRKPQTNKLHLTVAVPREMCIPDDAKREWPHSRGKNTQTERKQERERVQHKSNNQSTKTGFLQCCGAKGNEMFSISFQVRSIRFSHTVHWSLSLSDASSRSVLQIVASGRLTIPGKVFPANSFCAFAVP